jgi:hypothetical protein
MSIWNECEEFQAIPFYGFPLVLKLENDFIVFEFPRGYAPNGGQTDKVAKKLIRICGIDCPENIINDKIVKIKLHPEKLSHIIYEIYMGNSSFSYKFT